MDQKVIDSIRTIGFIGNQGKMARIFAPVFEKAGYDVIGSDIRNPAGLSNYVVAERAQVIVLAVMPDVIEGVIEQIEHLLDAGKIVLDICGTKEVPCAAMTRTKAAVIGLHPLFGPSHQIPWQGERVAVVCPERTPRAALEWLLSILERTGLKPFITTSQKHDSHVNFTQNLVHAVLFAFAELLRRREIDPAVLTQFSTPVFSHFAELMTKVHNQEPDLYFAMETTNPYFQEIIAEFAEILNRWRDRARPGVGRKEIFTAALQNNKQYLGLS